MSFLCFVETTSNTLLTFPIFRNQFPRCHKLPACAILGILIAHNYMAHIIKHNQLTLNHLLSNDRRGGDFSKTQLERKTSIGWAVTAYGEQSGAGKNS